MMSQQPYWKPSQLRQIQKYDDTLSRDAADQWLHKIDQFFWSEQNLAGMMADKFQIIGLCKNKLVKGAADHLLS